MRIYSFCILLLILTSCGTQKEPTPTKEEVEPPTTVTPKPQSSFLEELAKMPIVNGFDSLVVDSSALVLHCEREFEGLVLPENIKRADSCAFFARYQADSIIFIYLPERIQNKQKEALLLAFDDKGNYLDSLVLERAVKEPNNSWKNVLKYNKIYNNRIRFDTSSTLTDWKFDPRLKKFISKKLSEPAEAYKPIIYCYPESTINLDIAIKTRGEMTFSYPLYTKDGWETTVSPDGTFKIDGKNYPYLFWEGSAALDIQKIKASGFVLRPEEIIPFLEEKLDKLGFNYREKADFITYWAPKFEQNKYTYLHFLVNEDYTKYVADIELSVEPETMIRVYLLNEALDSKIEVKAQHLPTLKRSGFTLIEWGGGSLLNNSVLFN